MASDQNFDLLRFHRERQAAFRAHFETERDGLFDVFQRLRFGFALAHATWNGWALGHPDSIFVPVNGHRKFHV